MRCRRCSARLPHAAARTGRFRLGHLEPQYQARSRRRALSPTWRRGAGYRGTPRARAATSQRPSPGTRLTVRGAQLRLVGSAVLRHRLEGLRPVGGQARVRHIEDPVQGADHRAHPDDRDRGAARRCLVLRRPIRRRQACHQPGADGRQAGRRAAQLRRRDRAAPPRQLDRWAGCRGPRERRPA